MAARIIAGLITMRSILGRTAISKEAPNWWNQLD